MHPSLESKLCDCPTQHGRLGKFSVYRRAEEEPTKKTERVSKKVGHSGECHLVDAGGRKMTIITIHVRHFTEVKSWKALDLTIGFRYEEGVDIVAVIKMNSFQMVIGLRSKWKLRK